MLNRRALLAVDIRPELHCSSMLTGDAGARYQRAVRGCLDGELDNEEGGDTQLPRRFA